MVLPFRMANWKKILCVPLAFFVQLETPIAFDAIDNQPVDLLFALLVPADQTKTHLHTLSLVAKRLADKTICRRLRAAQSDEELYQIITDTEGTPDEA